MSRKLTAVLIVALVAAFLLVPALPAAAKQGAAEPTTWTVLVGGEGQIEQVEMGPAGAWQFMRFYPDAITINAGDSILFKLNSAEPHTVTFPKVGDKFPDLVLPEGGNSQRLVMNPLAALPQGGSTYDGTALTSSGQMERGGQTPTEYKLTFVKPGTYEYICTLHGMHMKGTVVVQPAGSSTPRTPAQVDADAQAALKADQQAAVQVALPAEAAARPGANGTTIYTVIMGYGDGMMAYMRFVPSNLTIHAGDSVEWVQGDAQAPHTVTFVSGGEEPPFILSEPQQGGPPKLVANPEVVAPAGGNTYSGQGYFNSGMIFGTQDPTPGPRTYSLTFDKPGAYEYICVLHDMMGMAGLITVLAKGVPETLPVTGGGSGGAIVLLWLAAAGLLFVGGLVLSRIRGSRAR